MVDRNFTMDTIEEGAPPISKIPIGSFPNGIITGDLGWAGMYIFESLGIASTVGIAGFESPLNFKQWAVSQLLPKLGSMGDLPEWLPVEVELYECWMPSLAEQFSDVIPDVYDEPPFSYKVWRITPDPDALVSAKRNVYALKLKTHQ